jgi:hypothetical protein
LKAKGYRLEARRPGGRGGGGGGEREKRERKRDYR